ncbi:MAG: HAD hydrolase-like protein, partial [Jatrophihabitantaceae bacterium]
MARPSVIDAGPVLGRVPSTVLFDLDGTLSDSAGGILASLRHAFASNGLPVLDAQAARDLLGPPFHQTLPPLVGEQRTAAVLAAFRAHQDAGARLQTRLFSGIRSLLDGLRDVGVRMAVATSKRDGAAHQVVEHLGIGGYFETVCGEQPDGPRASKAAVVAEVLSRLADPDPRTVLMVGDRAQDVLGARAHSVACLGDGWGYGNPGEL